MMILIRNELELALKKESVLNDSLVGLKLWLFAAEVLFTAIWYGY